MRSTRNSSLTRRAFSRTLSLGAIGAAAAPDLLLRSRRTLSAGERPDRRISPNENIQIAIVGNGGMGELDVGTALSVPGVRIVAACDLFDGRLTAAKEMWGQEVFTTRDYREILERSDVDAIICATPDHWHHRISVDALNKGKPVYCEKPMVHSIGQGKDIVEAEKRSGVTYQVGSQGMSSLGNEKAKELYEAGEIGELNYAEGFWARNSPTGAWQYEIPQEASPETVDWDRYLETVENKVPYDPLRFFRWRNYRDYGTGVAGDLFVHLFSSLHFVVSSIGPTRIAAMGGLRFWRDGREVPDVMLGMFEYPEAETHPPFNLSLRVNFVDGTSGSTFLRLVGSEGAMDVLWDEVVVYKNKKSDPTDAFLKAKADESGLQRERKQMLPPAEARYVAEDGYLGAHCDHFANFFDGVRAGKPVAENSVFGFRAAAPALAANMSYFEDRIVKWNPVDLTAL